MQWIGVKSSNHFRASYEPFAAAIYRAAFPSVQPSIRANCLIATCAVRSGLSTTTVGTYAR